MDCVTIGGKFRKPAASPKGAVSLRSKHSVKWIVTLLAVAALLALLCWFLWKTDVLRRMEDLESFTDYLNSFSPWSQLVFFLIQLAGVVVAPVPSNVSALAGSACFGLAQGFFLTFAAVTLGSVINFAAARTLGREWAERTIAEKLPPKYLDLVTRKRDSFLVLVFLFPFFPDDLICILAGLTDISFRRFFLIVLLTRHWGLLCACAIGSSLFSIPAWLLPAVCGAGVLLFFAGLKYGDRVETALLRHISR